MSQTERIKGVALEIKKKCKRITVINPQETRLVDKSIAELDKIINCKGSDCKKSFAGDVDYINNECNTLVLEPFNVAVKRFSRCGDVDDVLFDLPVEFKLKIVEQLNNSDNCRSFIEKTTANIAQWKIVTTKSAHLLLDMYITDEKISYNAKLLPFKYQLQISRANPNNIEELVVILLDINRFEHMVASIRKCPIWKRLFKKFSRKPLKKVFELGWPAKQRLLKFFDTNSDACDLYTKILVELKNQKKKK
jgi:hypothetical protein